MSDTKIIIQSEEEAIKHLQIAIEAISTERDTFESLLNSARKEFARHQTVVKELQDMIAFLILFVPDLTERQRYVDWLTNRKEAHHD